MPEDVIRTIDDYDHFLQGALANLRPEQRTAFTAAMAERFLPVYAAFSKAEQWGDPAALRCSLDAVWQHLTGETLSAGDIDRHLALIADVTPHMDDFAAEEALAAAVLVGEAVRCCRPGDNLSPAVQAAISGFEAVLPGWSADPGEQLRLWQKNIARKEFSQQTWLLDRIRGSAVFDEPAIQALRQEFTSAQHAGPLPKPKAAAGPPRLTNQALFEQYRRMVDSDIRSADRAWSKTDQPPDLLPMLAFGRWAGRYSRRKNTLDGSFGAWADTAAQRALPIRSRAADAAVAGLPDWPQFVRFLVDQALKNPQINVDARSLEEPHGYGPSVRRLWMEAKQRGRTDAEAWADIAAWALHRPAAWEGEDHRKKKGKAFQAAPLAAALARRVSWANTADPFLPWSAALDGQRWQVQLNDFPDDYMYALVVDGQVLGKFHAWPETWDRH